MQVSICISMKLNGHFQFYSRSYADVPCILYETDETWRGEAGDEMDDEAETERQLD